MIEHDWAVAELFHKGFFALDRCSKCLMVTQKQWRKLSHTCIRHFSNFLDVRLEAGPKGYELVQ